MWGVLSACGIMKLGAFLALATPFLFRSGLCTLYVHTHRIAHLLWGIKLEGMGKAVQVHVQYIGMALSSSNGIVCHLVTSVMHAPQGVVVIVARNSVLRTCNRDIYSNKNARQGTRQIDVTYCFIALFHLLM